MPAQPLVSAWDDYVALASNGSECYALMTALFVPLQDITMEGTKSSIGEHSRISLPVYSPPELPVVTAAHLFNTNTRCLVHLSSSGDAEETSESFCVFLFEVLLL